MKRKCERCEFELNTAWFRDNPETETGLNSVCKMCESIRDLETVANA